MVKGKSKYFWCGLAFHILGFCLIIYLVSIKLNQIGIGFSLISIVIAFISIEIAYESDKKIKDFAHVYIIELVEKFRNYSKRLKVDDKKDSKVTYNKRNDIFQMSMDLTKVGVLLKWVKKDKDAVKFALDRIFEKLKFAQKKGLLTDEGQNLVRKMKEDAEKYNIIKKENS